jgi:hypothetical protein
MPQAGVDFDSSIRQGLEQEILYRTKGCWEIVGSDIQIGAFGGSGSYNLEAVKRALRKDADLEQVKGCISAAVVQCAQNLELEAEEAAELEEMPIDEAARHLHAAAAAAAASAVAMPPAARLALVADHAASSSAAQELPFDNNYIVTDITENLLPVHLGMELGDQITSYTSGTDNVDLADNAEQVRTTFITALKKAKDNQGAISFTVKKENGTQYQVSKFKGKGKVWNRTELPPAVQAPSLPLDVSGIAQKKRNITFSPGETGTQYTFSPDEGDRNGQRGAKCGVVEYRILGAQVSIEGNIATIMYVEPESEAETLGLDCDDEFSLTEQQLNDFQTNGGPKQAAILLEAIAQYKQRKALEVDPVPMEALHVATTDMRHPHNLYSFLDVLDVVDGVPNIAVVNFEAWNIRKGAGGPDEWVEITYTEADKTEQEKVREKQFGKESSLRVDFNPDYNRFAAVVLYNVTRKGQELPSGNHWIAVMRDPRTRTLYIQDPIGSEIPPVFQDRLRNIFDAQGYHVIPGRADLQQSTPQHRNNNCGPIAVYTAEKLLETARFPNLEEIDVPRLRTEHNARLEAGRAARQRETERLQEQKLTWAYSVIERMGGFGEPGHYPVLVQALIESMADPETGIDRADQFFDRAVGIREALAGIEQADRNNLVSLKRAINDALSAVPHAAAAEAPAPVPALPPRTYMDAPTCVPVPRPVIVFDFDHTLIPDMLNNRVGRLVASNGSVEDAAKIAIAQVKEKKPDQFQQGVNLFLKAVNEVGADNVYIATNNAYPEAVKEWVKQALQGRAQEAAIINGQDDRDSHVIHIGMLGEKLDQRTTPKNGHLQLIAQRHRISPEQMILIDDNLGNVTQAKQIGARALHVNYNPQVGGQSASVVSIAQLANIAKLLVAELNERCLEAQGRA